MKAMKATRWLAVIGLFAGGGMLQFGGCASEDLPPADDIVNYCVVFDCPNGAFGGVIEWCSPNFQAFNDCP